MPGSLTSAERQLLNFRRWFRALLPALLLSLLAICGSPLWAQASPPPETNAAAVGSYDVAPVRILGIPAISVAAPVVSRQSSEPDAQQRAAVIEGNLSLLYQRHSLCDSGEAIAEALLEGLVLGGPDEQRMCSGNPWAVLGQPNDLFVVVNRDANDQIQLQAELKGRPTPLPLLSVTTADAQLYGLSRQQLAQRWRQLLQRRLRHARFTEQDSQLSLRLKTTLLMELLLAITAAGTFQLWSWMRRRLRRRLDLIQNNLELKGFRVQQLQLILRGLFLGVLVQLVLMVGLAVAAVPGRIPLAIVVLLQPLSILFKVVLLGLFAAVLRVLVLFVLRQWATNLAVPIAERARREQRYQNLLQASQRLIELGCIGALALLVLIDIPGFRQLTLGAWLAGGALLGGLAIAFQGLLRDGVAGLVALLDDHYAVGDVVEVNGVTGEVIDVGILVTELRTADQRVLLFSNSCAQQLVNHTKIRSGAEVLIPLAPQQHQLEQALALVEAECLAFAAEPAWSELLLAPPWVRGVKQVTPLGIDLSVVLTTRTGKQWSAQRALLQRLVVRLQEAQIPLAFERSTDL